MLFFIYSNNTNKEITSMLSIVVFIQYVSTIGRLSILKFEFIKVKHLLEDHVLGTWYFLSLKKKNFEGSTRYQMQLQNFSKIFRPKYKVFGPVQISKKNFFCIFIFDFLGSLYRCQMRNTKTPRNRRKKFKKSFFLGICTSPNTLFLDLKIFEK
jgi:hypothetical protein